MINIVNKESHSIHMLFSIQFKDRGFGINRIAANE